MFGNSFGTKPNELKTGTLFGKTTAPFGPSQPAQQQPAPSLFNTSTAQNNTGGFGLTQQNASSSMFGGSLQQQQQPQQAQQQQVFGGLMQPVPTLTAQQQQALSQSQQTLPQLSKSTLMEFSSSVLQGQREKSSLEQMQILANKWDPKTPDCAFQYYFYNQVPSDQVPFYGPRPNEDPKKWDDALSNKPSPGSIPVLARGFEEMAARIQFQELAVNALQSRLHEINASLSLMKNKHELEFASRITEARRRHITFAKRTLALAAKVQILRNRGYAMDATEEDLKKKLAVLERKITDPVLAGRQEEIWARMSGVRERARILQEETERLGKTVEGQKNGFVMSEGDQKQLDKILSDFEKQLQHLGTWVEAAKKDYEEWEKDQKPSRTTNGTSSG